MSPLVAFLKELRPRPTGTYIGEKSITKLAMYLYGYEQAVENLTGIRDYFLFHFREWLETRLQDRIHGMENSILLKSKDESDAVDYFWKLLDEFLAKHPEHGEQAAMTPEDFIRAVVNAYRQSRIPLRSHPKLCRGENRTVASETEAPLAYYLVKRIPEIDQIYINQPLRTGTSLVKPDLVICQSSRICAFVDVKMDLGYRREEFDSMLRLTDERVAHLRGQLFRFRTRGAVRIEKSLPFSEDGMHLFVIVSPLNISSAKLAAIRKTAESLSNIRLYFLTRGGGHPNAIHSSSVEELMARINICHDEFQGIEHELQRLITEIALR